MASDLEKHQVDTTEDMGSKSSRNEPYETDFTPEEQRKLIHRIDRRLVVTVGVLYCISLMDRTNMSAAAIAGWVRPSVSLHRQFADAQQNDQGVEAVYPLGVSHPICQFPQK